MLWLHQMALLPRHPVDLCFKAQGGVIWAVLRKIPRMIMMLWLHHQMALLPRHPFECGGAVVSVAGCRGGV